MPSLVLLGGALLAAACRQAPPAEVEVEVRSVGVDGATQSPVVLLQDRERRRALPIWIGPLEAQSIAMQIEGISPPRPMTHDLLTTILQTAGVELRKVVIHDLKGSTYYARIHLVAQGKDVDIDSRPSDAIAIAVRLGRPIFVATALLEGERGLDLRRAAPAEVTAQVGGLTVQELTGALADHFDVPAGTGVLVAAVEGQAGGLQRGDVILAVDGDPVRGVSDLRRKLGPRERGGRAILSVQRGTARIEVALSVPAS